MEKYSMESYLVGYALFSLIVSLIQVVIIRTKFERKWMLLYLFIVNLTIPFCGIIITSFVTLYLIYVGGKSETTKIKKIHVYESLYEFPQIKRIFGEAFIREALVNKHIPVDLRLKAVVSISAARSHKSIGILRDTFRHQDDEIRLYSHNIVATIEKRINTEINGHMDLLQKSHDPDASAQLAAKIARLYWELLYLELVDDALRSFYVEEAKRYALDALQILHDDVNLRILTGRIYLYTGNYKTAYKHFMKAIELKSDRVSVVPYIAEVLFLRRKFKEVGELLSGYPVLKDDQLLNPVYALWEG